MVWVVMSSLKLPCWYGLILLLWSHFRKSPFMVAVWSGYEEARGRNNCDYFMNSSLLPLSYLSPPPFPAVSSIGIEAERRKNRAGKRERSTRGSAVEITQKWCLLPHKWNNKKVFKYRTGSTSSEVNLLCQRVTTITKHYFWPLGLSNMFREVYTTKVDDFSERDSGSFPLLI